MPIGTPFHARTSSLSASQSWRIWSGYWVASSYLVQHEPEYHAIRNAAALIDVSPLYKYEVRGRDAVPFLNRLVTRDVTKCSVKQAVYTCLCDEEGKVIQDGTLFRLGENVFRLHLADPGLRWCHLNAAGMEVEIQDVSESIAVAALQGPFSRDVLKRITEAEIDRLRFFHFASGNVAGAQALISRTGYTGDLGYEIWTSAADAERLWDALTAAGRSYGLRAAGMLALDMARLEAGFVLIEVDYSSADKALIPAQKYSPYEIGLGWTVNMDKGNFVGRQALLLEKQRGAKRQLVGLEIDFEDLERLYHNAGLEVQLPRAAWRDRIPVYQDGRQIGRATTGCWSPILKKYIALAMVDRGSAKPGLDLKMEITVEDERRKAKAVVVKLPFFDPPRKRA
jgi:aminomethyltransferase